jgi:hypothetical protein
MSTLLPFFRFLEYYYILKSDGIYQLWVRALVERPGYFLGQDSQRERHRSWYMKEATSSDRKKEEKIS